MTITFMLLAVALLLELGIYLPRFWRNRRALAGLALVLQAFATGALVVWWFNIFTALFVAVALYRLFNLVRIAENRIREKHLFQVARRTSLVLLIMQAAVVAAWLSWAWWHDTSQTVWTVAALVQVVAAGALLLSVTRNMRRMRWPAREANYSDRELPSITVAIPARNETEDLQACLQSLIASDYPKLEIIVLDDCSQLKRTPEIIRGFAHDGVRFIQGEEPDGSWLPKNQAYARLTSEASGAYILFCGVDIRFQPHTLRETVSLMLDRKKEMVSILPRREQDAYGHLSMIQAMRYWWELAPPRRLFNRPPVLSSVWMISAHALTRAGGFAAVARSIVPEAHFARQLLAGDAYSFMRASVTAGVSSVKRAADQQHTAVRTRYPQVHRRPEQVLLASLAECFFLLLPWITVLAGFWIDIGALAHVASAITVVLLLLTYQIVVLGTHVNSWWFSLIGHPLMVIVDIYNLHYSMWKYEFSTVEWKGRNVCIPAMQVIPRLPDIDKQ
jgi:glycosyltransferase involved in cell wall biosynthesis